MENLYQTKRIEVLKEKMLSDPRYASIEQARIITRVYKENENLSIPKKRALSLKTALEELEIGVEKEELIVGNRTKGVRYGVVFPKVVVHGWKKNLKLFLQDHKINSW